MGADFGVHDSIEELLDLVGEAIEMGAPRIKLKCAKGWVRITAAEEKELPRDLACLRFTSLKQPRVMKLKQHSEPFEDELIVCLFCRTLRCSPLFAGVFPRRLFSI